VQRSKHGKRPLTEPKCLPNCEAFCTFIENFILVYCDHGSGKLTLT
jgi:hypothetical protein